MTIKNELEISISYINIELIHDDNYDMTQKKSVDCLFIKWNVTTLIKIKSMIHSKIIHVGKYDGISLTIVHVSNSKNDRHAAFTEVGLATHLNSVTTFRNNASNVLHNFVT